jgi:hypothetical protein
VGRRRAASAKTIIIITIIIIIKELQKYNNNNIIISSSSSMHAVFRVPWNAVLAVIVFFLACLSTSIECIEMGFTLFKHSVDTAGAHLCECFVLPSSRSRRIDAEYHLVLRGVESGLLGNNNNNNNSLAGSRH